MKYLFFVLLVSVQVKGQVLLDFNKRFVESEDRWVAYQMDKDSTYLYGFIYIDEQAGLTFNYKGHFKIGPGGVFYPLKLHIDSVGIKVRLMPNNVKVAFISESKFEELQIKAVPEWLAGYKQTKDSVARMYKWGFMYNSWDESLKALEFLERAYNLNPNYKGLRFELAFAYNALKNYEKSIPVLEEAIANKDATCLIYKELVYAEANLNQLNKAEDSYRRAALSCTDKVLKGEMALNIAYHYYLLKDFAHFSTWANEVNGIDDKSKFSNIITRLKTKLQ